MNKLQALIQVATRTIGRLTKLRMKHMSLLPYQTIHHQYDHPHLMITQPQLIEYRTVLTKVGLLLIHITLDRTTSAFHTQLHLEVTIGNRSSTNLRMNKPPKTTVMETIWFQEKDPRFLNNPHSSNYNPLLSYRNLSEMPFDSRDYNFVKTPLHNLKDRVSEYFPPLPSENTNTVKRSTKIMGRDKLHQSTYPILSSNRTLHVRLRLRV